MYGACLVSKGFNDWIVVLAGTPWGFCRTFCRTGLFYPIERLEFPPFVSGMVSEGNGRESDEWDGVLFDPNKERTIDCCAKRAVRVR